MALDFAVIMANGRPYVRRAWTGGDSPPRGWCELPHEYRSLVRAFMREQATVWRDAGLYPQDDTRRILWNRARGDAFASLQDTGKVNTAIRRIWL